MISLLCLLEMSMEDLNFKDDNSNQNRRKRIIIRRTMNKHDVRTQSDGDGGGDKGEEFSLLNPLKGFKFILFIQRVLDLKSINSTHFLQHAHELGYTFLNDMNFQALLLL